MASFTVTFADTAPATLECDGYAQEGPLLTFFTFPPDRDSIDAWSRRIASFRVDDIASIVCDAAAAAEPEPAPVFVLAS